MDEAKQLVHMSVSAIFAAMILAVVSGIIALSYLMWSYFSRQDAANRRMSTLSNLTAFDNQTVRGTDALWLLTKADDLGIYVILMDDNSGTDVLDNCNNVIIKYVYFEDEGHGAYTTFNNRNTANASTQIASTAYSKLGAEMGVDNFKTAFASTPNLHNVSIDALETHYFTETATLGSTAPDDEDNYGVFKAIPVYAFDGTTDIDGIILVRAGSSITNYCYN